MDETSLNRGRMKWLKRMMGQIMATTKATKYSNFCPCFEMSKVLTRYIQVPKYPTRYNPSPYHQSEKLVIVANTFPFFFWVNGSLARDDDLAYLLTFHFVSNSARYCIDKLIPAGRQAGMKNKLIHTNIADSCLDFRCHFRKI